MNLLEYIDKKITIEKVAKNSTISQKKPKITPMMTTGPLPNNAVEEAEDTNSDKKIKPLVSVKQPEEKNVRKITSHVKIFEALNKKSESSGISLDIIGEIYRRGLVEGIEQRYSSPENFAFSRINSFIAKGKSFHEDDSDLARGKIYFRDISENSDSSLGDEKSINEWVSIHPQNHNVVVGKKSQFRTDYIKAHKHGADIMDISNFHKKYNNVETGKPDRVQFKNKETGQKHQVVYRYDHTSKSNVHDLTDINEDTLASTYRKDYKMVKFRKPDGSTGWRKQRFVKDIVEMDL